MLELALDTWGGESGVVHWARALVNDHALNVKLTSSGDESVLSRLFPPLASRLSDDPQVRRLSAAARRFAEQWYREEPGVVADRMLDLRRQGELSGYPGMRPLDLIAGQLAELVDDPSAWLEAFAEGGAPDSWIYPFLATAIAADPADETPWRTLARVEGSGAGAWAGLQVGLYVRDLPDVATRHIMAAARRHAPLLRDTVDWSNVSDEWLIRLLTDRNEALRGQTAAALWELHQWKRPPGHIGNLWEEAAVTCGDTELLDEVVGSDRDAAVAWLVHESETSARRKDEISERTEELLEQRSDADELAAIAHTIGDLLDEREGLYSLNTELLETAVRMIGPEDRRRLIREIPADADLRFFEYLVAGDRDLYAAFLSRNAPREAHLAPIRVQPVSQHRSDLARLAREHGYSEADLEPHSWES